MAEDLSVPNPNANTNEMVEISIVQPHHPNQAAFLPSLNIPLQEFRAKLTDGGLILPENWLFMTRAGSLVPREQEEEIEVIRITRDREEENAVTVMVSPPNYRYEPGRGRPAPGASPLASLANILGALRDVYVTTIQPNMHDLIKPLIVAAAAAAVLAFILSLILALCLGVLGGLNHSVLAPFFRHNLCWSEPEMNVDVEIPRLYKKINELEARMSHMRQVEVGTLTCKEDHHMYEERETTTLYIPFRKTHFSDAPRVTFGLREVSVDDFHSVRLEGLQVNSTGFSVRCSYFGKWMHYNMEFTWIAVGK